MLSAPQLSNARGLGWDPLHPHAGGMLWLTAEVLPPPKSGDIWGQPPHTGGSPVPSTGQDPAPVPAGAASHCPPRRLCSSRSPRRRAAPSHRSAAQGCRRPARDPTGAGTEPGDPAGGSLVSPPPDPPPYLQRLQEAEGAQAPAAGHDAEGGVVQQLLVVEPGGGTWWGSGTAPPPTHVHPTGFCWHPTRPGTHPVGLGWTRAGFGPKKPPLHRAGGAAAPWEMPSKGTCCRARNQTHPKKRVRRPPALPGGGEHSPLHTAPQCSARTPEPETAVTPAPCPGLQGRSGRARPSSIFFLGGGQEGRQGRGL